MLRGFVAPIDPCQKAVDHLEGDGLDLHAVPGLVVVDLGLHGLGEEVVRVHSTSIVREIPGDIDARCSQTAGAGCEDVEGLRGIALRIQDACCRVLGVLLRLQGHSGPAKNIKLGNAR